MIKPPQFILTKDILNFPSQIQVSENRIPIISDESMKIFSAITNTSIYSQPDQLNRCIYDLKHVNQRLQEAKQNSTKQKISSLLSVALMVTTATISYWWLFKIDDSPETLSKLTRGELTRQGIKMLLGSMSFLAFHLNGFLAGAVSESMQEQDTKNRHGSILGELISFPWTWPVAAVVSPFIATYRIFNRIKNLKNRVKPIQLKILEDHQKLKNYFNSHFFYLQSQLSKGIEQCEDNLVQLSDKGLFGKSYKELSAEIVILKQALIELRAVKSFYQIEEQ